MSDLYAQAIKRFDKIYTQVQKKKFVEPTHMILATASKQARPSARVVLLKSYDQNGFVFYTNTLSQKGRELTNNPYAALVFFWDPLNDQIRIEGNVKQVADSEADEYWISRPRNSQIGAWASEQSSPLENRRTFLKKIAQISWKYKGKEIPRPPYWTGFRLVPDRIEFWVKKPFRLHERQVYERVGSSWKTTLLFP